MFHWICPECGREIPPAVKECPECDPQSASPAEAIAPPLELPKAVKPPTEPVPAPRIPIYTAGGYASVPPPIPEMNRVSAAALEAPAAVVEPPTYISAVVPPGKLPFGDLGKRTLQLLPSAQAPILLTAPSGTTGYTEVLLPPMVPNGLVLAVESGNLIAPGQPAPLEVPEEPALPIPPSASSLAMVAPTIAAGNRLRAIETQSVESPLRCIPPVDGVTAPDTEPVPVRALVADRPLKTIPPLALRLARITESQDALPMGASDPVRPSLVKEAAPGLAGLVNYSANALTRMRAAAPQRVLFVPANDPRTTLPGPALPRELISLAAAGLRTLLESPRGANRRRSATGFIWLALATIVVLSAVGLYVVPALLVGGRAAPVEAGTSDAAAVAGAPASGTYPLSKTIEVTGFRFVVDLNGKSEIHYLVVNHSSAQFGAVTVFVTLRDLGARPGQPPVARFSFRAPDMGPYTSREMTSPIEKISRPVALPEWQDLHADVEIAE